MPDNVIRSGDLVAVVKPAPCCGNTRKIGLVFTAGKVEKKDGICRFCDKTFSTLGVLYVDPANPNRSFWLQYSRLQKINGLPAKQETSTTQPLKETV